MECQSVCMMFLPFTSVPCTCAQSECMCLLQTLDQFEYDGCENCDKFLHMKNNRDNVLDCTSSNFDG